MMRKPKLNDPADSFKGRRPATWEGEIALFSFIAAAFLMAYFGVGS
jgi:hypothetical protein